MNKKTKIFFGLMLSFAVILPITKGSLGTAEERKREELMRIQSEYESYKGTLEREFAEGDLSQKDRLEAIRLQMEEELQDFDSSKKASENAEAKLRSIRKEITTLAGQVKALEIAMEATEEEIDLIKMNILKRTAEMQFLAEEAEKLEADIESQMGTVLDFFALLQSENATFAIADDEIQVVIRTLLSGESFSHNYWKEQQILALERAGRDMIRELEEAQEELDQVQQMISEENIRLRKLKEERRRDEQRLESQMSSKAFLKETAEKREERFAELLEETRQQMMESSQIIKELEENKEILKEKMDLLDKEYRSERIRLAKERKEELLSQEETYEKGEEFLTEDAEETFLSWPVYPRKGISAYFHDDGYEDVFHMEHDAIDIPVPQGSEIKAPALGYVYKISDNGMGYSSLILAHRNNIMTAYGHVSEFLVEEGDMVHEGDIIALSGGMPGTKGAGLMTTGPHLHLEVFEDGEHVDPLLYLPLSALPPASLPHKYLLQ